MSFLFAQHQQIANLTIDGFGKLTTERAQLPHCECLALVLTQRNRLSNRGWMASNDVSGSDKILYTTGRLTSEMVIKTAQMGIPILVSRSGFTAWGVEIADKVGLTLIGRMRGQRFTCLAGSNRLIWDVGDENGDDK